MVLRNKTFSGLPAIVLALASCRTVPPVEEHRSALVPSVAIAPANLRGLVDVRALLPDVVCDLRYATRQNVTKQSLYYANMPCLLNARTAEKLRLAQHILRAQGFGLKIWDAWRPPEVQVELFRFGQRTGKGALFVDPHEAWSFHCSGTAVDVTLVDRSGHELRLPTYFDEAGARANIYHMPANTRVQHHIRVLQEAMLQAGFAMIDTEWWHFDDASFNEATTRLPVVFAQEIGVRLPELK